MLSTGVSVTGVLIDLLLNSLRMIVKKRDTGDCTPKIWLTPCFMLDLPDNPW